MGARSAEPSVRPTRTMPVPSARSPSPRGGRFGARRTTSSRRHRTRTASSVSSASSRARAGTGLRTFPPKAPPLPSGAAGRPPGRLQLASGSTYAGSIQVVCSVIAQSPAGTSTGWDKGTVLLRPWTRPAAARAARTPGASSPSAPSWTSAPAGAESSANPPPPRTTSGPVPCMLRPSTSDRQAARSGSRRPGPGGRDGRSTPSTSDAASTMDCHPVQRHRWARSAASTSRRVGGVPEWRPSRAASRMTMPGVQNPHWLAPAATKADDQRWRSTVGAPSSVVT